MTSAQPRTRFAYDEWMEAQGIPVYRGYFVPDMRAVALGRWEERGCDAAFVQLVGQEGVSEARITEIPPGETLPPYRMAVDELVYVVSGGGATTLWSDRPGAGKQAADETKAPRDPRSPSTSPTPTSRAEPDDDCDEDELDDGVLVVHPCPDDVDDDDDDANDGDDGADEDD